MATLGDILLGAASFSTSFFGSPEQQRGWQQIAEDRAQRQREFDEQLQTRRDAAAEANRLRELQYGETTFTIPGGPTITGRADLLKAVAPEVARREYERLTPEDLQARSGYQRFLAQPPRQAGIAPVEVAPSVGVPASPVPTDVEQAMLQWEGVPATATQAVESAQGPVRAPVSTFMPLGARLSRQEAQKVEAEVETLRKEHVADQKAVAQEARVEGRTAGQNRANNMLVKRYTELRQTGLDHPTALTQALGDVETSTGFVPDSSRVGHGPPERTRTQQEIDDLRVERFKQLNAETHNLEVQYSRWKAGKGDPPNPTEVSLVIERYGVEIRNLRDFPGETTKDKVLSKAAADELTDQRSMWISRLAEVKVKSGWVSKRTPEEIEKMRVERLKELSKKVPEPEGWLKKPGRSIGAVRPMRAATRAEKDAAVEVAKLNKWSAEQAKNWLRERGIDPDLELAD